MAEAAYNSNWYHGSTTVKKSVAVILMRSQKPVLFRAAGLIDIKIATFSSVSLHIYVNLNF